MSKYRLFIVDDDAWYLELLEHRLLADTEAEIHKFSSGKEFLAALHLQPDIVTIDYGLNDMNGSELLKELQKWNKDIPAIIVSGQDQVDVAIKLLHEGATDYIVKDQSAPDLVWNSVRRIRENQRLKMKVAELDQLLHGHIKSTRNIVAESDDMKAALKLAEKAARTDVIVNLIGESGTGKGFIADLIHRNSKRRNKKLEVLDLRLISEESASQELFGAYSDPSNKTDWRHGKLVEAFLGSVLIKEIGLLNHSDQRRLLEVLESGTISTEGVAGKVSTNFRLMVSSSLPFRELVLSGKLIEPLYNRLVGLEIKLAPLRQRKSDVIPLAEKFADNYAKRNGTSRITFSDESKAKLLDYHYPKNIIELRSAVELASAVCTKGVVSHADIRFFSLPKIDLDENKPRTMSDYQLAILHHFLNVYNQDAKEVSKVLDVDKDWVYEQLKTHRLN